MIVTFAIVAALVICAMLVRWLAGLGEATNDRRYFAAAAALGLLAAAATWAYVERNADRTGWDVALGVLAMVYFAPKFASALHRFGQLPSRPRLK